MALLASAATVAADIVGFLILGLIALAVYFVVQLLFLPKTSTRPSRRLEEEERRRERNKSGRAA